MLILGSRPGRVSLPDLAEAAVAGGVDAIQVRMPGAAPERVREVAAAVRERIGERAALLVNGDPETAAPIAAALDGGVHLPERAAAEAIAAARAVLGSGARIGRSVHSPEAAAVSDGVDYLLAGHVFSTASHPGAPPLGLAGLGGIVAAARRPVLAVGGIDAVNVAEVIRVGAAGVAAIGAIVDTPEPERAARALRAALDRALEERLEADMEPQTTTRSWTEEPAPPLAVTVNGKLVEVAAGWTVHDFLASKRLSDEMALVELNGTILARTAYGVTSLREGDQLEVVHAVGGG